MAQLPSSVFIADERARVDPGARKARRPAEVRATNREREIRKGLIKNSDDALVYGSASCEKYLR
jgi:hypothetical protein